ncbi:MAG: hypothetical protein DRO73_10375 [Candidatus Thorarchaeota archaeon]|nr:MAG: hypothetical protein DRO73_10375 [Candidatus Thorarchaeota archaeon]
MDSLFDFHVIMESVSRVKSAMPDSMRNGLILYAVCLALSLLSFQAVTLGWLSVTPFLLLLAGMLVLWRRDNRALLDLGLGE